MCVHVVAVIGMFYDYMYKYALQYIGPVRQYVCVYVSTFGDAHSVYMQIKRM